MIETLPAARSIADTATGWITFAYSISPLWGFRSGDINPSIQNAPSLGLSPKSPP